MMWLQNSSNLLSSRNLLLRVYIYFISAALAAQYKQNTTMDRNFISDNVFQGELGFYKGRHEKESSLKETKFLDPNAEECF